MVAAIFYFVHSSTWLIAGFFFSRILNYGAKCDKTNVCHTGFFTPHLYLSDVGYCQYEASFKIMVVLNIIR